MQTVGQKFAAEREKRGISIRDAADATKIRADFLASLESDDYEFELPEIYKRGFVKNYARFLKLDTETLINDYTAQRSAGVRSAGRRSASNDLIGMIDLGQSGERKKTVQAAPEQAERKVELERPAAAKPEPISTGDIDDLEDDEQDPGNSGMSIDKLFLLKVGTVFVGAVIFIIIAVVLVQAIIGGSRDVAGDADAIPPGQTAADAGVTPGTQPPAVVEEETLTLSATGALFIIVDEPERGVVHLRENLVAGDERSLSVGTPVRIRMTASNNLEIGFRGETVVGGQEGVGVVTLP